MLLALAQDLEFCCLLQPLGIALFALDLAAVEKHLLLAFGLTFFTLFNRRRSRKDLFVHSEVGVFACCGGVDNLSLVQPVFQG